LALPEREIPVCSSRSPEDSKAKRGRRKVTVPSLLIKKRGGVSPLISFLLRRMERRRGKKEKEGVLILFV